jgi:ABC-type tungstate transport system permease subunit
MSHATRRGPAAERAGRPARLLALSLALSLSAAAAAGQSAPVKLRIATTTSVDNSGTNIRMFLGDPDDLGG